MTTKIDVAEMLYTLTSPAVALWPNVAEAKSITLKSGKKTDAKYSATFAFEKDHPDLKPMLDKARGLMKRLQPTWDDAKIASVLKQAFVKGDDLAIELKASAEAKGKKPNEEVAKFLAGKIVVKAGSKYRPATGAIVNGKATDFTEESIKANDKLFYSGCLYYAQFKFDPMETQQGDFLVKYLQQIFSLNKGDKIGGGVKSASSTFASYAGKTTAEDPTEGLDDILS